MDEYLQNAVVCMSVNVCVCVCDGVMVCRLKEPIEFIPHVGGLGLGALPRAAPPKKKNWIKKPGEEAPKVLHTQRLPVQGIVLLLHDSVVAPSSEEL